MRVASTTETILGPLPKQTDLEDYREVDGVKLPFSVTRSAPDFSSGYMIASVKHNVPVSEVNFDKPTAPLKSLQ